MYMLIGKDLAEMFVQKIELEDEPLPFQSLIEIVGNCRVLIENHKGITHYSREKVCVRINRGVACVCGSGLTIAVMRKERLVICGKICGIDLMGGNS